MASRSAMLQKKLYELESELTDVFRLPLDTTISDPRRQLSFEDVENRFSFLDNLLAAEVASQPQTSGQLREVGQRLTGLKDEFRYWNKYRTGAFSNLEDTPSVCSDCTQALLNDAVAESGPPNSQEEKVPGEKSPEKFFGGMGKGEDVKIEAAAEEEEVRMWGKVGNYCGVFGCGMITGAICMVELVSYLDHLMWYEAFQLPPT
ncbi:hypothetical protein Sango_2635400 [Sesamum angolense]|uniref:DUF7610 domain-containing protein n=1 Tax=Sesamum angolense TaxID=2727404 RepID=A0AAE2BGT1_9LAMI|nr:hypothetical protein Sango_2635400 [Sesamum angolense]